MTRTCENCKHVIKGEFTFSLCRRTAHKGDGGETKYVPIMMERNAWANCCGPDAKFFEAIDSESSGGSTTI